MLTKDGRDTPIEKLTPDNYIVPAGEERFYHAVIEVVQYDPKTGKKLSHPRVQKFGKKMFESHVRATLLKQGYTITILHEPSAWIKASREKAAEMAKAKKAAEEKRFNDAVAAAVTAEKAKLKAELLAELKSGHETSEAPENPGGTRENKPGRTKK